MQMRRALVAGFRHGNWAKTLPSPTNWARRNAGRPEIKGFSAACAPLKM